MSTKPSESLAQKIESLSPAEQSCFMLLLDRMKQTGFQYEHPQLTAAEMINVLAREWIFASHLGRFDHKGHDIPMEAFDVANEAWQNFPRKFPEPEDR